MKLFKNLREIDWKFFLGLIIGLAFGALSIYTAFYYRRTPRLTIDVISNTSVLDVREQIGNLEILFGGSDIAKRGEALRILTVRFINAGRADILGDRFDTRDKPGFRLSAGRIVQNPELIDSSNEYLGSNAQIELLGENEVRISPVILEVGENFTIKLLVLSTSDEIPSVEPIGKIAGQTSIAVANSYLEGGRPPFVSQVISGEPLVQLARLVIYFLAGLLLVVVIVAIVLGISTLVDGIRRRALVRRYLKQTHLPLSSEVHVVLDMFRKNGVIQVILLSELMENENLASELLAKEDDGSFVNQSVFVTIRVKGLLAEFDTLRDVPGLLRKFEVAGIFKIEDSRHSFSNDTLRVLPDFLKFLRNRNFIAAEESFEVTLDHIGFANRVVHRPMIIGEDA